MLKLKYKNRFSMVTPVTIFKLAGVIINLNISLQILG